MVRMAWATTVWESEEEEIRKGPWTFGEDIKLRAYVSLNGAGGWSFVAKAAGLKRSGKSCRMRWLNYLRPDLNRSRITPEEKQLIIDLQRKWGNKWSRIAQNFPGRTDNEIKNYWRSHIKKKCSCPLPSKYSPQIKAVEENTAPSSGQSFNTQPLASLEHHQKDGMENGSPDFSLPTFLNQVNIELYNCTKASLKDESEAFSLNMHALSDKAGSIVQDSLLSSSCSLTASPMNYFSGNDVLWDYTSHLLWNFDNVN